MEESKNVENNSSKSQIATGIGLLGVTGLFDQCKCQSFQSKLEARTWASSQGALYHKYENKTVQEMTDEIYDTLKPYVDQLPDVIDQNAIMEETINRVMKNIIGKVEKIKNKKK